MNIKELHIMAFGRFKDKKFTLKDNLNIIYGLNEGGKSTLHQFIEAMFFGFVKPGMKRRIMSEEYNQYRPWTGELYGGSLVYETGGRLYKVERNLEKGREDVKVFDALSGEELTNNFYYDKTRREVLFAREHLGLGYLAYKNTISIGQLSSRSDGDLAREIQTRLGNRDSAMDLSLSINRAEKLIREYLDEIGTERARAKEYGQLHERAAELKEKIEKVAARAGELRALGKQLRELETEYIGLRAKGKRIEKNIGFCEEGIFLDRWEDIQRLRGECNLLTEKLREYDGYRGFDHTSSSRLYTLEQLREQDIRDIQGLRVKAGDITENIETTEKSVILTKSKGEKDTRKGLKRNFGICLLAASIASGAIYMAITLKNPYLYMLSMPFIVLLLYSMARILGQKNAPGEQGGVLGELDARLRYYKTYRKDILDAIGEKERALFEREREIAAILKNADAVDTKDYKAKAMAFETYTQLKDRLDRAENLLEIKLDGEDMATLKARAESIKGAPDMGDIPGGARNGAGGIGIKGIVTAPGEDYKAALDNWRLRLQALREEEVRLVGNMENIRGSLGTLEKDTAALPEMEEELSRIKDRLGALQFERTAAETALRTLRTASSEIHHEFAPVLNRKVSGIVTYITGGRYTDLRVTKGLEITAVAPETGRHVKARLLSGGTLDQFYFALRIAVAELLSGNKDLPLILDDCFMQYDQYRLENVFAYLLEEARRRQIILLTCHNRERDIADTLGEEYNYLTIY